jgi:YVTN family beta-propeller protein
MTVVRRLPLPALAVAVSALAAITLGASGSSGPAAGSAPSDPMARFYRGAPGEPAYPDPTDLAVTSDGRTLAVACSGIDALRVLDLPEGTVRHEIPTGRHPSAVALGPDGRTAYVAGRDDDTVTVADLETGEVLARWGTGRSPQDVLVGPDGRVLFTANAVSGDVSFIDLATGRELKRMRGGERPRALALSRDGRTLAVANLLADPHLPDEAPVGQVTLIDLERGRLAARVAVPGTNLLRGVAALPDGSFLVPLVRPKNLIPLIQVDGGWQMTNGVALIPGLSSDPRPDPSRDRPDPLQLLVDTRGHHWADLTSAAVSADGATAYVTAGGADRLLVLDLDVLRRLPGEMGLPERDRLADRLDLAPRYVRAAIPTGANPRSVALSPDGARAYVADRLGGTVSVVDTAGLRLERRIDLDGPAEITRVRRGELLFHNAAATFHGQFTCVTCHPDSGHDGLVYDISPDGLGRNLVDSKTLHGVAGTAPFKWSGHNPDLRTQCGPRAALFINRSLGFGAEGTEDVVAYMAQIPYEPNRDRPGPEERLTPLQHRGKEIFERTVDNTGRPIPESNRCGFCHSGPRGTSNRSFDVGTRSEHDDKGLFDTPGLNNLAETGPYLHDGKALSLEELWTVYNPDDRHGRANDMSKEELNALIEYLRTF